MSDNSLAAQKAWEAREDAWLAEARAIDPAAIEQESLKATYAILREALGGRGRSARVPQRTVERQPDDRLAREPGIPGDDSAGRHR